jgi:hypothetical protein
MLDSVSYVDSLVLVLAPGDSAACEFGQWQASPGTFEVQSFTGFEWDVDRANDTAAGLVVVSRPVHDVSAITIVQPGGVVGLGTTVTPLAVVANLGPLRETFSTRLLIGSDYRDTVEVGLESGQTDTVSFADWVAEQLGLFEVRCTTMLAGDAVQENDRVADTFEVAIRSGVSEQPAPPLHVELAGARPNPFTGATDICYSLPSAYAVSLRVVSAEGRVVRSLAGGKMSAGRYRATWDGGDAAGRPVGAGVYFVMLEVSGSADRDGLRRMVRRVALAR